MPVTIRSVNFTCMYLNAPSTNTACRLCAFHVRVGAAIPLTGTVTTCKLKSIKFKSLNLEDRKFTL